MVVGVGEGVGLRDGVAYCLERLVGTCLDRSGRVSAFDGGGAIDWPRPVR